ncbi:MAG TPA: YCF48-related protein, partial [Actinomycetota bacterium]|nr:YCF48-related protein [Actinomycetota bacterium]
MSDDEDELRRHLHDPRWELPVAGDAEERIRQAARRDRRVRFAGALGIILLLGTAATGYGLSRQSGPLHVITPAGSPAVTPTVAVSPTPASSPEPAARAAIPAGFQAESVTFVSANEGWVLGGACATCTAAILHTADGGKTWAPVPAPAVPLAQAPDASNGGVSAIRFANANDGWLFGPELWSTHDGGASWSRPGAPGLSSQYAYVDDLEAANGLASAAVLTDGNG